MTAPNIHPSLTKFIIDIDQLCFDGANTRVHDKKNLEAIKNSLSVFGQRVPIVVQKKNKVVRAGNGRLEAAQQLGWDKIAAIFIDDDNITATAYAIADNRTAELAEWDEDALAEMLSALRIEDGDLLSLTGFNSADLESLTKPVEYGLTDSGEEWEGMPEYEHQDLSAYQKLVVNFRNEKDVQAFSVLVEQTLTSNSQSLWYPKEEWETAVDKVYK